MKLVFIYFKNVFYLILQINFIYFAVVLLQ